MPRVITEEKYIKDSIKRFRNYIKINSKNSKIRDWVFPNGDRVELNTFVIDTKVGELYIGISDKWDTKISHVFKLNPEKGKELSPNVEINIPLKLNRSISGVYIERDKDIWLCSRGHFNAFRGKIKKEIVFNYFDKWVIEAEDGPIMSKFIPVAALSSPNISAQIASFISKLQVLKESYKNKPIDIINEDVWNDSDEYEGRIKGKTRDVKNYEYLHGPICNKLKEYLTNTINLKSEYNVRRNKNIDVAIIKNNKAKAIFEVKTSTSISEQITKGIGQLFYYRHKYGDAKTNLYLIIPKDNNTIPKDLSNFASSINIYLLTFNLDTEKFEAINGTSLKSIMKQHKFA